ncbi:hypothetical protein ACFVP3_35605 [Streptomyces sp. NPDC057806]|uniref:hypothetical protein n=1 Tax=unclassified Streptomyces TaxID=2593676 RepID=UPI0036758220
MGVLARLLRRSKASEETSAAEAGAGTTAAGSEAEETAQPLEATEAKGSAGTEALAPQEATATEAVGSEPADGVEIPKQQSADEAAEREAGESARS